MRYLTILLGILLVAPSALGDAFATMTPVGSGCMDYTLCNAEADTGVCSNAAGTEEIVGNVSNISNLVFFHDESAGNWSCDIYANSQGYDDASGAGDKISTAPLTQANLAPATAGALAGYFWAYCGTISSTVTITMRACPIK